MKKTLAILFALTLAFSLAACAPAAPSTPAPTSEPTAVPTAQPTAAPTAEPAAEPTTAPEEAAEPYFIAHFEDGTPAPETMEAKIGKDNAIRLFFTIENSEGVIGWDSAFDEAGIQVEMNFDFINEQGLLLIISSEKATECKQRFYLNATTDFANPEVLQEQYFTFVFSE